jgi:hypothetical protein
MEIMIVTAVIDTVDETIGEAIAANFNVDNAGTVESTD